MMELPCLFVIQYIRRDFLFRRFVLLRPKNFVRHFQDPDMKCKLPLSTNNLALLSLLSF
jgi:hypothetical protein